MSNIWWAVLMIVGGALPILGAVLLVSRYLSHLVDERIAAYQSNLISKQMNEVENIYHQMRGWRHDFHNHIQPMQAFLKLGELDELRTYLGKLNDDLSEVDRVLKTGNVMADAILNSKLSLASSIMRRPPSRQSCECLKWTSASSSGTCWTTRRRPVCGFLRRTGDSSASISAN